MKRSFIIFFFLGLFLLPFFTSIAEAGYRRHGGYHRSYYGYNHYRPYYYGHRYYYPAYYRPYYRPYYYPAYYYPRGPSFYFSIPGVSVVVP